MNLRAAALALKVSGGITRLGFVDGGGGEDGACRSDGEACLAGDADDGACLADDEDFLSDENAVVQMTEPVLQVMQMTEPALQMTKTALQMKAKGQL